MLSWAELRHCAIALGLAMAVTVVNPWRGALCGDLATPLTDRFMIETLREWAAACPFEGWAGRAWGISCRPSVSSWRDGIDAGRARAMVMLLPCWGGYRCVTGAM